MKQFGLLFIIFSIIPLFASAHAGPFDRYLQQMVSSRALLVILLLTHLCVYLLMRFGDKHLSQAIKKQIRRVTISISPIFKELIAWLLSTVALGLYLGLIANQIFFWGALIFLLFYPIYVLWIFCRKWRNKYLCGHKVVFFYMQTIVAQVLSFILYSFLCGSAWFGDLFSYFDDWCHFAPQYLAPRLVIIPLCDLAVINLFPFSLLWIIRGVRALLKRG
ncbi:MAG: hypothetical protein K2I27_03460 [Bacteroides sp.]|nr:hypothetical protein [Bacteroides sp.]